MYNSNLSQAQHNFESIATDVGIDVNNNVILKTDSKIKVGVLCPAQQPGLYWDRSLALPHVGVEPTQRSKLGFYVQLNSQGCTGTGL